MRITTLCEGCPTAKRRHKLLVQIVVAGVCGLISTPGICQFFAAFPEDFEAGPRDKAAFEDHGDKNLAGSFTQAGFRGWASVTEAAGFPYEAFALDGNRIGPLK